MFTFTEDQTLIGVSESFAEFAENAASKTPEQNDWIDKQCLKKKGFVGRSWSSWKRCIDDACGVWPEGQKAVQKMREAIESHELPKPRSKKRKLRWNDDAGDEVCMDRLRAGGAYWRETHKPYSQGPSTIALISAIASPCGWEWDTILWRAAATLVLADILEEQGYRVELWAASYGRSTYDSRETPHRLMAVRLKADREPLDIATATAACSGWAYRSVWFKNMCLPPNLTAEKTLGMPSQMEQKHLDWFIHGNAAKYVVGDNFSVCDEKSALDEVRKVLKVYE